MMFLLMLQSQFFGRTRTRNRRRTFAIFGVLMLSLFFVTQIHHATLQRSSSSVPSQEEQGDAITSLPPFTKRPKQTSVKTKADDHLLHVVGGASDAERNNNKDEEGHNNKSSNERQLPLQLLELVKTQKVQKTKATRIQKQDAHNNTTTTIRNSSVRSRPPLDTLVQGDAITGNVSWLLDFAILGHAKCATTFLSSWFREHPHVQTWDREVCDLNNRKPADLVRRLYQELPAGDANTIRGFKCPGHFSREPLRIIRRYFGQARLIVGLRHPVRWFESYFNFRIRHPRGGVMPTPDRLIGKCVHDSQGVCTDRANFHRNLAMFGKTNMTDRAELGLLDLPARYTTTLSTIPNRVFLYDVGQLYDQDEARASLFRQDLTTFLGLKTPLTASSTSSSSSSSLTSSNNNNNAITASTTTSGKKITESKNVKYAASIDICHADYEGLRHELVEIGKRASVWIVQYFMQSEQVVVSSPDFFASILQSWNEDPCRKQP